MFSKDPFFAFSLNDTVVDIFLDFIGIFLFFVSLVLLYLIQNIMNYNLIQNQTNRWMKIIVLNEPLHQLLLCQLASCPPDKNKGQNSYMR